MKKICVLVLSVLLIIPTFAQPEKGYIYLKNGSILKGRYMYSDDYSKLQVLSAGNVWIFNANEVDTVTSLQARRNQNFNESNNNSPFYMRTEIGVLAGNSDNSQNAPFSFSSTINYQLQPLVSVGIGGGLEFFKESYLPLYINLEYKWRNQSYSTPYFFLKTGYMIPLDNSNEIYYYDYQPWSSVWPANNETLDPKGGFIINSGVGYQQMFSTGFGMSFAFGYQFHRLHYKGTQDYGLDIDYNRLTIKLGIIFN